MLSKNSKSSVLWFFIFLPYLLVIAGIFYYLKKVEEIKNSSFVIINKADMTLSLYDYTGNLLQKSEVATGKVFGDKKVKGDVKTPEGVFSVIDIQDASNWTHDFKDDTLGDIKGAYGPYFIRLGVPGQNGIGIHGTHDSSSIGTRASEGCIRMQNQEIRKLVPKIKQSTIVVIVPGIEDVKENKADKDNLYRKSNESDNSIKRHKKI